MKKNFYICTGIGLQGHQYLTESDSTGLGF